jgi:hypothetical protein
VQGSAERHFGFVVVVVVVRREAGLPCISSLMILARSSAYSLSLWISCHNGAQQVNMSTRAGEEGRQAPTSGVVLASPPRGVCACPLESLGRFISRIYPPQGKGRGTLAAFPLPQGAGVRGVCAVCAHLRLVLCPLVLGRQQLPPANTHTHTHHDTTTA